MAQEFSMKQTDALYSLLNQPIQPLVVLANRGIASIRERFRRENISGGIGKEVPFAQVQHVLEMEQIPRGSITPIQIALLLTALSRYPETRIVNAQLFLLLLSFWGQNSPADESCSPHPNNKQQGIDATNAFSNAVLHGKAYYPEIMYVFDVLNLRLPSVVKDTTILSKNIRKEELLELFKRCGIVLAKTDQMKLFDILIRAQVLMLSTDDVSMKLLIQLLSIVGQDSPCRDVPVDQTTGQSYLPKQSSTTPYNNFRVYSHILNRLRNNARLIRDRIRIRQQQHGCNPDMVHKSIFREALQDSGIALTDVDISGLWNYMFESERSSEEVSFSSIDAKLFPTKLVEERTTLETMSEQLPYHRIKKGPILPASQSPYAIESTASNTDTAREIRQMPPPPPSPSPLPSFGSRSNLCQRISHRVANLPASKRIELIGSIVNSESKVYARTNVAKLLADFGIKALHADSDEIWSDISRMNNPNKPYAFLEWLGIDSSEYLPFERAPRSSSPTERSNFQKATQHPNSIFGFVPPLPPHPAPATKYTEESVNHPWDYSVRASNRSDLPSNQTPQYLHENEVTPSYHRPPSQILESRDMAAVFADEAYESSHSNAVLPSYGTRKLLAAIVQLQKNRANLAFLFRKMLGKEGRLDDNGLSLEKLASALLEPPISLDLTKTESNNLVSEMLNHAHNVDTSFSTTPRVFFRDVLHFLDTQPTSVQLEQTDSSSARRATPEDGSTYRNNFLRYSIKTKLLDSAEVMGDRLKLLSLVPRLKSRHRSLLSRGRNVNTWDSSLPDYCSSSMFKEILQSIDVILDAEEMKLIHRQLLSGAPDSSARIGDYGFKLGDAIHYLIELLD